MLVAGDTQNADRGTEQIGDSFAECAGAVAHTGEDTRWHTEQTTKVAIPFGLSDIEQQRACGIGGVGQMFLPAGETPKQKAIDGTESELAVLGSCAGPFDVVEQPGDLARGKIWIEQQSGLAGNFALMTGTPQRFAIFGRAPVLPYNRVVDGLARFRDPK